MMHRRRTAPWTCLLAFGSGLIPWPARAQSTEVSSAADAEVDRRAMLCDVERSLKQAQIYLRSGNLAAARGTLEMAKLTEDGYGDPVVRVWLAIVATRQNDFDTAGREVNSLAGLGEPVPDSSSEVITKFLNDFSQYIGTVIVEAETKGQKVAFRAEVDEPPTTKKQGELMSRFLEANDNVVQKKTGERFYVPAGAYRFGEASVEVIAGGDPTRVNVEEIGVPADVFAAGDGLPEPEPFPVIRPQQWEQCVDRSVMRLAGAAPEPWVERNKWWLIGGGAAAVVTAVVVIAVAASASTEYNLTFDPTASAR